MQQIKQTRPNSWLTSINQCYVFLLCIFAWQPLEISRSMILLPFQIYETSVDVQNICGGSVGLGDGGQSAELPTPAGAPGPRCRR